MSMSPVKKKVMSEKLLLVLLVVLMPTLHGRRMLGT